MTATTARAYGAAPKIVLPEFDPAWTEFMHYLYLPVFMPGEGRRMPERLRFLEPAFAAIYEREGGFGDNYVYVTAKRGYVSPTQAANRPGWHSDGFGSDDVNYVWASEWPTEFLVGPSWVFGDVSDDHIESAAAFDRLGESYRRHQDDLTPSGALRVERGQARALYRLTPDVIHATPTIPAPGGLRSFLKVSVSPNRYNLLGNSHNHLFDYAWPMYSRDALRNDPAYAGGDAGPQDDRLGVAA